MMDRTKQCDRPAMLILEHTQQAHSLDKQHNLPNENLSEQSQSHNLYGLGDHAYHPDMLKRKITQDIQQFLVIDDLERLIQGG